MFFIFIFIFIFVVVTLLLASTVYFTFVFLFFIFYAVTLGRRSGRESGDKKKFSFDPRIPALNTFPSKHQKKK